MPRDVVAGCFGTQDSVVPDVSLDGAVLVVGPNHGITEMKIFDCGLEFAAVILGDLAPKSGGGFIGLIRLYGITFAILQR